MSAAYPQVSSAGGAPLVLFVVLDAPLAEVWADGVAEACVGSGVLCWAPGGAALLGWLFIVGGG